MISFRQMTLMCLVLLLGATPLHAQPEQSSGSSAPADTGAANEPAATGQAPAPDKPAANTASAGSANSPFDYRASEEISEDVPVSFPVDI